MELGILAKMQASVLLLKELSLTIQFAIKMLTLGRAVPRTDIMVLQNLKSIT